MVEFLVENIPLVLTAVGLVLMILEAISPGAHLIVVGIALVGAGIIGLLFPAPLSPFVLAGLTLLIGLAATYVYREFDIYGGKDAGQTSDSSSLAGQTGYVTETVTTRSGEVKLESGGFAPYYSARTTSGTIEEGEEIIVLDPGGGNVLTVDSFGRLEDDEIDRALAREAASEETPSEDSAAEDTSPERELDDPATETEQSG